MNERTGTAQPKHNEFYRKVLAICLHIVGVHYTHSTLKSLPPLTSEFHRIVLPNCRPASSAGSSSDSTSAALRPPVVTRANTYSLLLLPSAFTMTSDGDTPLRLQKPRSAYRRWIGRSWN